MKLVYSNENRMLANNVKNIIEAQGIHLIIKNEFAQGAIGELSVTDSWPEIWVVNDDQYNRAVEILASIASSGVGDDWLCKICSEENTCAFDICWNCQSDKP
tara:strand:- start:76 stop:381 length:306 start_codon:yes stop_codon:yes gene_type:complete